MALSRPILPHLPRPLKLAAWQAAEIVRLAWLRTLPDFIVIGAQRAGTTSLFHYLSRHPGILTSFVKEVHFFDQQSWAGLRRYRTAFPFESTRRRHEREYGRTLVCEASPNYLHHPATAPRVRQALPEARFIVLLRDPVDRALSNYYHEVRRGFEMRPIEDAFAAEEERLAGEEERLLADPRYFSYAHWHFAYRARGRYADQLERWFAVFPRDRFLVLKSEAFFSDTPTWYGRVVEWLGLPRHDLADFPPFNLGEYDRRHDRLREQLRAYYEPHNRRLTALLGPGYEWPPPADRPRTAD